MKHKMWSRLLSMALAVMMIVSIVPNSAFAEAANEITSTSQVQEIPAEETQTPEEVTVPEAETPAEPSTEPAPTEEPVAEPTAEPTVEPTAEPTQAPAEIAVPSEQPSAEPTAAPEATETPNASAQPSETPAASETPVPSESPVPSETPAPSEEPAIDGQALLDELMAIEDDETFLKAVGELTEEQTAALEALGEEALVEYAQRVESLTAAKQKDEKFTELYDKLMAAETWEEFEALLDELSEEEFTAFEQWLSEEQKQEVSEHLSMLNKSDESEEFIPPVNFSNVAPLSNQKSEMLMWAMGLAQDELPVTPKGLEISKTISQDANGQHMINLEAYTTGEITSSGGEAVPADVVLVLDVSGSMNENINGRQSEKKISALKNAVNGFIESIAEDAQTNNVDYRVSIVKFAGKSSDEVGNDTYWDWWNEYNCSQIVKNLTSVSTNSGEQELKNAVNSLKPGGATRIDYGLQHANTVLQGNNTEGRNQIVVVFTDGEPTSSNSFEESVANSAITEAKKLKDRGVTVYTIGVFSGADGANPADLPSYRDDKNNRFMHLVSSNYPDATKVKPDRYGGDNTGALNSKLDGTDKSYYLSANDSETLNKIFQDISDEIQGGGSSFKLDDKAVIKDVMSDYFQLPEGTNEEDVTVEYYKADYSGDNLQWTKDTAYKPEITKTVDQATGSVSVTGFDFDHNFVTDKGRVEGNVGMSGDFYGRKIKISFPVEVKPEFLGGNNVLTNSETASGIYQIASTENPVGVFTSPNLNVPVKADVQKVDRTIHLTTSITADQLFEQTITPNGTNNAYVTITYTVKDSRGIELGTYTIQQGQTDGSWSGGAAPSISPDECSNYTITCTVTPNTGTKDSCGDSAVAADEEEANSTVHVLYPTVQAKDKYIALGESTDFDECWNHGVVNWYDVNAEHTNNPAPVTTAPKVTDVKVKEVNGSGDAMVSGTTVSPKQDTDYNIVAVKLGNDDSGWITDPNKFKVNPDRESVHNTNGHDCIKPTTDSKDHDFTIHVYSVNGDLIITKSVKNWNSAKGNDAAFVFKIEGGGKTYYCTINLNATNRSDSETITLPAGTYTVTELPTAGYKLDDTVEGNAQERSVVVSGNAGDPVKFTNTSNGDKTPGDNSSVLNKWLGTGFAKVTSEAANG